MLMSLLIGIAQQHTTITFNLLSDLKKSIIIDNYLYFFNQFDNRY